MKIEPGESRHKPPPGRLIKKPLGRMELRADREVSPIPGPRNQEEAGKSLDVAYNLHGFHVYH